MHQKFKQRRLMIEALDGEEFGVLGPYRILSCDDKDSPRAYDWSYTVECIHCGHQKTVKRQSLIDLHHKIRRGTNSGKACRKCKTVGLITNEEKLKLQAQLKSKEENKMQDLHAMFAYGRRG